MRDTSDEIVYTSTRYILLGIAIGFAFMLLAYLIGEHNIRKSSISKGDIVHDQKRSLVPSALPIESKTSINPISHSDNPVLTQSNNPTFSRTESVYEREILQIRAEAMNALTRRNRLCSDISENFSVTNNGIGRRNYRGTCTSTNLMGNEKRYHSVIADVDSDSGTLRVTISGL